MTSFVQNILWNSVSGFVEAGTRTAGGYAGDALIKAGDLIENSGRSVGNSIERKATSYGTAISGQSYKPSAKPLPSTARRPAAHRSNSVPTPSKPSSGKPTSGLPLGANKYPGGKQVGNGAKSVAGGVKSGIGSVAGGPKGVKGTKSAVGSTAGGASKAVGGATKALPRSLPKPYPQQGSAIARSSSLPKPYPGIDSFSGSEKKTAVNPSQSKPFKMEKVGDVKPYPGTNTLPGQGGKTPVRKKYKPLERMAPPAERGKAQHIAI